MKLKNVVLIVIGFIVLMNFSLCFNSYFLGEKIRQKIEQVKPKETKTIEDYHNLISQSKEKIEQIAINKWLKISDIKQASEKSYCGRTFLQSEEWQQLLKKAKSAPVIWKEPIADTHTLVDVEIGITAQQIIKALQSIDPNDYIRHKEKEQISNDTFVISVD